VSRTLRLIEKVEGEVSLSYRVENGRLRAVSTSFFSSRGVEKILRNREAMDALVINPRVCGICGHAHLMATVRALESAIGNPKLTAKAEGLRELTLSLEMIQNHFKWFFLTIAPLLGMKSPIQAAIEPSRTAASMIAVVAGQYPHNSYAIPGGVVCEPTIHEKTVLLYSLEKLIGYFTRYIVDADFRSIGECEKIENILRMDGYLPQAMRLIMERGWERLGRSRDRFIVFGENGIFRQGKSMATRYYPSLRTDYIEESFVPESGANSVRYRGRHYETGPLARAMVAKRPLVREAHRRYGDSLLSRIMARVCEIASLLHYCRELIAGIDLSQESYIEPGEFPRSGVGWGVVEAARGSLIHRVEIEEGLIADYSIITPTQWNLVASDAEEGILHGALEGESADAPIELIFKSFDVCSVCTTH
jgi:hydrogenase large subunit